ncbi:MAG: class I SAM-dependent methyltransferase [Candidatus Latescibacterota bacterium]|nr:MAG: class I SAM-dependent methyltransferase [Candidatus Latescibacterota bacterium]
MDLRDQMDEIYRGIPTDRIPWNIEQPPELLVELIDTGRVRPCDAIDIGCGAVNYTVWLAAQGFRMTGIDISPAALELAQRLALDSEVECEFVEDDITGAMDGFEAAFDFGLDWEVLHHVFPDQREAFVRNVHRMLRPGAKHLSVCFSEQDRGFGVKGRYRETPLGTTLYFSSEPEIEQLYAPLFDILELGTKEITGKYGPHVVVAALLERK